MVIGKNFMSTIVLTGGGTAGHVVPCFALLPDLKKHFDEIYYIGRKEGVESDFAKKHGVTFFYVPAVKLERRLTLKNALIPIRLLKAISTAKHLLKNLKPDVVFSKGGYVALPVVIAAGSMNTPVVSHESDLTLGLANKIALKYSSKLLTGFEETAKNVKKAEYTGIPLDKSLFKARDKNALLKKFGLDKNKKTLLVTGGSQGASAINSAFYGAAEEISGKYNVIWLCGKGKLKRLDNSLKNIYEAEFAQNMGEVFAVTDLCVSRAGANTLFELIALNIPTAAIPLPKGNSRGDQEENAAYFKRKGAIAVLPEDKLSPESLIHVIKRLDENSPKFKDACSHLNLTAANVRIISILSDFSRRTQG